MSTFVSRHLAKRQIVHSDLKSVGRLLIEVEAASNLDYPAMIELNLAIMHARIQLGLQDDGYFQQTLRQLF